MRKNKPHKLENLLDIIQKCIDGDKYTITAHALSRQMERKINIAEIIYVLKTGYEEKIKTRFDEEYNVWKYAIRGKTKIDNLDIRVITTIDENGLLIITVMHIGEP